MHSRSVNGLVVMAGMETMQRPSSVGIFLLRLVWLLPLLNVSNTTEYRALITVHSSRRPSHLLAR